MTAKILKDNVNASHVSSCLDLMEEESDSEEEKASLDECSSNVIQCLGSNLAFEDLENENPNQIAPIATPYLLLLLRLWVQILRQLKKFHIQIIMRN